MSLVRRGSLRCVCESILTERVRGEMRTRRHGRVYTVESTERGRRVTRRHSADAIACDEDSYKTRRKKRKR